MTLNLDAAGIIRQGHALGLDIAVSCGLDDQQQIAVCLDAMLVHDLSPEQLGYLCRRMLWPETVRLVPLFRFRCERYTMDGAALQIQPRQPGCGAEEYSARDVGRLRRCDMCQRGGLYRDYDAPPRWALRDAPLQIAWPKWYKPSPQRKTCNRHVLAGRHPTGAELGAEGETCGSCRHRNFDTSPYKCALGRFTRGPATDVLLKWRRCARWQKRRPFGIGAPEIRI